MKDTLEDPGHVAFANQTLHAGGDGAKGSPNSEGCPPHRENIHEGTDRTVTNDAPPRDPVDGGGHVGLDPQSRNAPAVDHRFTDPLVQEIVEIHRQRRDMMRAAQRLTLQIKANCRRFVGGDLRAADALYRAMTGAGAHELAETAYAANAPLFEARVPVDAAKLAHDRHLKKLGARLPIAGVADEIKGVHTGTLATIVGECGDLSAYAKGVAGVWKRAGLAVIDGERQRRVAGEAALVHGYAPERRSVFWNIGAALLKAQGTGDEAGPYRAFYDAEKARQMDRGLSKGHAHNRACRHMTKLLIEDLWRAWREVSSATTPATDRRALPMTEEEECQ